MVLLVVISVAVVALFVVVELSAVLGFTGFLLGERVERCPRCGRFGLTIGGKRHEDGCPASAHEHLAHPLRASSPDGLHVGHGVHLRHH